MQSRRQRENRSNPSSPKSGAEGGSLRIIGGEWRGRRLNFPALNGLRPTADRVRETLFNWLAPRIQGARCLDMFAGSGALGLEALSRGADHCDFLELQASAANTIKQHLSTLKAGGRGTVFGADALKFEGKGYDIVFVDPPFAEELSEAALAHLLHSSLLAADARIYLELGRSQSLPPLEPGFEILRDKTAGDVRYLLLAPVIDLD